jgi:hypothetical protein
LIHAYKLIITCAPKRTPAESSDFSPVPKIGNTTLWNRKATEKIWATKKDKSIPSNLDTARTVINLTHHTLSADETSILAKGCDNANYATNVYGIFKILRHAKPQNNVTVKEKRAIRNLNKKEDLLTHENSGLQGQNYYLLESFLPYWWGYEKKMNLFAMA